MRFKPYVKKPLIHSPRGSDFLANLSCFEIRTPLGTVRTMSAGQCLAALLAAKQNSVRCLVYAVGSALGEEGIELVDEEFLLATIEKESKS